MNTKTKQVEMRSSKFTVDGGNALQKGTDFLRAFTLGFDVDVQTYKMELIVGCNLTATFR
jgi:rRNA processing protein Krr1/Pno1